MPRDYHRFLWLILAFCLVLGVLLIYHHAASTPTYTIDSYFYLSKAKQLADGNGLRTTWNDGVDTKYFPGYSIFLALPFLFGGSYVIVQIVSYLLCALLVLGVARQLEFGVGERMLAATAFAANPIVIKWFSLPMAEGVALVLSLLSAALFLRFAKTKRYPLLFAACMIGGVVTVTRGESLFLLVVFGVLVFSERKNLSWPHLLAGGLIFLLPLLTYWLRLRMVTTQGSAYFGEFRHTILRFDILKNLLYNGWVPFGFMHRPGIFSGAAGLMAPAALAGVIWIVLGQLVFVGGLAYSLFGRLGSRVRVAGLLFLAYTVLHSFWYYRSERFMLMSLPLAAIVWAAAAQAAVSFPGKKQEGRLWPLLLIQVLIAASGLYWGNQYSLRHSLALQHDTAHLQFQLIAKTTNELTRESGSAVLTDLGPHLAYYLEEHTYMDTGHGNYWQRAFPPESTLQELDTLGIRIIVTKKGRDRWLEEHHIPPGDRYMFRIIKEFSEGASIIGYLP